MQYMGFTAEERICELEDTVEEIIQNETQKDTDTEIMEKRLKDTEDKGTYSEKRDYKHFKNFWTLQKLKTDDSYTIAPLRGSLKRQQSQVIFPTARV